MVEMSGFFPHRLSVPPLLSLQEPRMPLCVVFIYVDPSFTSWDKPGLAEVILCVRLDQTVTDRFCLSDAGVFGEDNEADILSGD